MLLSLPLDIILEILSNFQIHELHSIQLASRVFNEIVRANESQLYHTLAIQYNFVEPSSLLDDVSGQFPGPLLDSLRNWKDLFRRMYRLELNWQGRGDVPHECYFLDTGFDVHRFKVDEINRLIITTHRKGGLRVSCMDSYALLWALSRVCRLDTSTRVTDILFAFIRTAYVPGHIASMEMVSLYSIEIVVWKYGSLSRWIGTNQHGPQSSCPMLSREELRFLDLADRSYPGHYFELQNH